MSKTLIIAEKPSVASDIARAVGGFTKKDDYYESEAHVLASAVGHLLEIAAPEQYDVKRGKWSFAHLPVIPPHFDLNPIAKSEAKLKTLKKLLGRKDVTGVINACDAGREGELIFRYIMQFARSKLPVQRLWLQSMTPAAIREAFAQLRSDADLLPLADAARCRSEADWLVGINGTRAMTAFNSKDGGFYLTTVGRVQTPTLAIVVEREERIKRFVSRDFWEVKARFAAQAGPYEGRWYDPAFRKDDTDAERKAERLWDAASAQAIVDACQGRPGIVTEEAKPSTQLSPALFDLTSLQREANGRFGFSAKTTLSIAQALYEKHKVLTYPRTDSRALPEDYIGTVKATLGMLEELPPSAGPWAPFARQILANSWVRPNKRVFDNTKVSDHFAIIPTLQAPKALSDVEQKLYDLVVKRFLAVFFPAAEYMVTTRITRIDLHHFKTEGRVLVNAGWLAIYGREAEPEASGEKEARDGDRKANLPPVGKDERPLAEEVLSVALATRPPPRYSEATLLSAMEGAGKFVDDEELREAMAGKGLGTPATRAAIIEGLINEKYLLREGREIIPTAKAFQLVTLLRGLGVKELTMPELTGEWEYKLSQMERGRLARETFMQDIAAMTQIIVERAKNYSSDTVPGDYATLRSPCPACGSVIKENYRRFACTHCEWSLAKIPGARQFEVEEVEQLLEQRHIGPLTGFRSKRGLPFVAALKLNAEHKLEFDFGDGGADSEDGEVEEIDFSGQTPLGECPKCGSAVYEQPLKYVCEKSVGAERSCDFSSGRVILQQPIERAQMEKLLGTGKTDLLPGFVSNKTKRKFKAFLVKQPGGKIGFEFEPRTRAGGKDEAADGGDAPATAEAAGKTASKAVAKPAGKSRARAGAAPDEDGAAAGAGAKAPAKTATRTAAKTATGARKGRKTADTGN